MFRAMILIVLVTLPLSATAAGQSQYLKGKGEVVLEEPGESVLTGKLRASFRNCTVEEAYLLMYEALDEKINVVVHPSAKDISVPDFGVKRASAIMISNLLCNLVLDLDVKISGGGEFQEVPGLLRDYETEENILGNLVVDEKVTPVILVTMATEDEDYNPIERSFRIYRMAPLIEDGDLTMDDIATAIETAWQMIPENYSATLKYHAETRLLICNGTEKHLEILDRVIMELGGESGIMSRSVRLQELEAENQTLKKNYASVQAEYKYASSQCESLTREVQDLKAQLEALRKSPGESR